MRRNSRRRSRPSSRSWSAGERRQRPVPASSIPGRHHYANALHRLYAWHVQLAIRQCTIQPSRAFWGSGLQSSSPFPQDLGPPSCRRVPLHLCRTALSQFVQDNNRGAKPLAPRKKYFEIIIYRRVCLKLLLEGQKESHVVEGRGGSDCCRAVRASNNCLFPEQLEFVPGTASYPRELQGWVTHRLTSLWSF